MPKRPGSEAGEPEVWCYAGIACGVVRDTEKASDTCGEMAQSGDDVSSSVPLRWAP
jgi:hypothetical protein